ncbi:DoxX family protein [Cryobacterium sp. SO1]|uniref:DoxX family protein n=1 Tax=Cryobacterium sp. SO1 TaxID=1897061 RepID=UPI001023E32E|nr:DoxX family protein [Cryobacterium sp. SO1]RZI36391.1 hypothetical protein BJQ95_01183 [Cryobacterium sp. SO1]
MEPLIALIVVTLLLLSGGAVGVRRLRPQMVPLRGGLAAMFLMTGVSHFVGMRAEMIDMVPPFVSEPELVVTLTGVLELAGAAGLLWTRSAPLAAACLTVLLLVMYPANVYAALEGVGGSAADALVPRTVIQIVFVSATLAVVVFYRRARTAEAGAK